MIPGHIDSDFFVGSQLAAEAQAGGWTIGYVGYIATYDVNTNTCTVVNTANADPDGQSAGQFLTPVISAPMQLGTNMPGLSGSTNPINSAIERWGIQLCPIGGGSPQNPTAGEQVLVMYLNQAIGAGVAAAFMYTDVAQGQPPGSKSIPVSNDTLKPGEWLAIHPSGTITHFKNNGDFCFYVQKPTAPVTGTGNIKIGVDGGISINTNQTPGSNPPTPTLGNIDVTANRTITLKSLNSHVLFQAPAGQIVGTARDLIEFESDDEINLVAQGDLFAQGVASASLLSENVTNVQAPVVNIQTGGGDVPETDVNITAARDINETATDDINMLASHNINMAATNLLAEQAQNITRTALSNIVDNAAVNADITAANHLNLAGANQINITTGTDGVVTITGGSSSLIPGNITEAAYNINRVTANEIYDLSLNDIWIGTQPKGTGTPQNQTIQITNNPSNHPSLSDKNITIDGRAGASGPGPDYTGEVDIYADSHLHMAAQNNNNTGYIEVQANSAILMGCNNGTTTGNLNMNLPTPALNANINSSVATAQMTLAPNGTSSFSQQFGSGPICELEISANNITGALVGLNAIEFGDSGELILSSLPHAELVSNDGTNVADLDLDATHAQLSFSVSGGGSGGVTIVEDAVQVISGTSNFVLLQGTGTTNFPVAIYIGAGVDHTHFKGLLTDAFRTAFNSHVHTGVTSGSNNSGPPSVTIGPGSPNVTTVLQAN